VKGTRLNTNDVTSLAHPSDVSHDNIIAYCEKSTIIKESKKQKCITLQGCNFVVTS
jgi:hypothetical protein